MKEFNFQNTFQRNLFFTFLFFFFYSCQPKLYTKNDPEPKGFDIAKDEASHHKNSLEWWYFTGHLEDSSQHKKFGIEYVLFHFSPTKFKSYAMVNLALSDPESPAFYYDYQLVPLNNNWRSGHPLNIKFDKKINFQLSGAEGYYKLNAKMNRHDVQFSLSTSPLKGMVLHDSSAYLNYDSVATAGYYSYPRLATNGTVILKNEVYQMNGNLWFDRQWNCNGVTDKNLAWDWFSVQFENNTELMVYKLYHKEKDSVEVVGGSYIDAKGEWIRLDKEEIVLLEKEYWFSHLSERSYPSKWSIEIDKLDLKVELRPVFNAQELELKFFRFKKFYYWEGMCKAVATQNSEKISGNAYVEMTNR